MSTTEKNDQPDSASGNESQQPDPLTVIRDVLHQEAAAINAVADALGGSIGDAVTLLKKCKGRVIVTGMGKMGCIARKAAATFCSTGTPAVFLHPGEAIHGDLGGVTPADVLIALSNSGETSEVLALLPYMQRFSVPVIAITGNEASSLAGRSSATIDITVENEADPDSLAPTSSTTVALAMCDALAICLMRGKGFTREQFAIFHPGGNLGKQLLLTVADLMHVGEQLPLVRQTDSLRSAILEISQKRLGAAIVAGEDGAMTGILTDGDLRRAFQQHAAPLEQTVDSAMTRNPVSIGKGELAAAALRVMQEKSITVLPVVNGGTKTPAGIIHLHDLLRAGLA